MFLYGVPYIKITYIPAKYNTNKKYMLGMDYKSVSKVC